MAILPKALYRFNPMPIRILMMFFTDQEKNSKNYMEGQKAVNNQESQAEGTLL